MAVSGATGFEAGQIDIDLINLVGAAAYSTAQARTGVRSGRCNPASGASGYIAIDGSQFIHFGLYIASLPSVTRGIAGIPSDSPTPGVNVRLNPDGTLAVYNGSTLIGTSAQALSTAVWYWIGWKAGATPSTATLLQIDGTPVVSGIADGLQSSSVGCYGTEASAIDLYFDDWASDDAGFLAPSKVDLALPISDNTVTSTTDGNGVTTNLWQSVDNTPPTGVASANEAANPKTVIRYPASLSENYTANLETYTTLGVASGDTILAVRSVIRHGEDIATGTKNGLFYGLTANPVSGNTTTAFVFGNDLGAHGLEAGLWKATFGDLITGPTGITLGNSPAVQVQRASQTRVGCLDFMGLLVVWTPAVVANPPLSSPYPQLLPQ